MAGAARSAQAARATAVLGFLESLFEGSDPAVTKGEAITARELLDRGAARADSEFAEQTELRAELKHSIGRLYLKLGLLDRAQRELGTALDLTPKAGVPEVRFGACSIARASIVAVGTADAGLARLDEAAALTPLLSAPARAEIAVDRLARATLHQRGDDGPAIDAAARAYAAANAMFGTDHPKRSTRREAYAALLTDAGRYREALPLLEHVAVQRAQTFGEDDPRTLTRAMAHGRYVLRNVDQLPRATALAEEVLERRRKVLGEMHPDTAKSCRSSAICCMRPDATARPTCHSRRRSRCCGSSNPPIAICSR